MEWIILLVLLVLGVVHCKREEVIFDSTSMSKLGWDTYKTGNNGKGWHEAAYSSGRRLHQVYSVCDTSNLEAKNWVTSPMFSTNGSDTLWLKIKYNLRECPDKVIQVCHFDIYKYETNTAVPIPLGNPWDHVMTINTSKPTSGSSVEIDEIVLPISVETKGTKISIGFKDEGSCSTIMSVKAYVIFCEATTMSLKTFPETSVLASDRKVKGQCVANAEMISEPQYVCNPDGEWENMTGECKCEDGFEMKGDNSCIEKETAVSAASATRGLITVSMSTGLFLLTRPYM